MRKKIVTLTLAMMLSAAMPAASVYADREDDLRAEQEATSQQLNETYSQIDNLYSHRDKPLLKQQPAVGIVTKMAIP